MYLSLAMDLLWFLRDSKQVEIGYVLRKSSTSFFFQHLTSAVLDILACFARHFSGTCFDFESLAISLGSCYNPAVHSDTDSYSVWRIGEKKRCCGSPQSLNDNIYIREYDVNAAKRSMSILVA
jgi:hypothetical protein